MIAMKDNFQSTRTKKVPLSEMSRNWRCIKQKQKATKERRVRARKHGPAQDLEAFTAQTLLAHEVSFIGTRGRVLVRPGVPGR